MTLKVNLDLVKKYSKPGPRYTSYPTAPHFGDGLNHEKWKKQLVEKNQNSDREISLYFHIPFCDTLCYFCGCTMMVTRNQDKITTYLDYLSKEMDLYKNVIHPEKKVTQMHFGGGTPTHLTPDQIRRLGEKINSIFSFDLQSENGCEMDPRELTEDHIIALKEIGVNRASMGVQDFDPVVQKAVNRINSKELVYETISWIRKHNYESLNLDLIYGLPHQSVDSFEKTIDGILELDPDRLAVFNYAHVPWMKPHMKLIKEEDLPHPEQKLEMLKMIIERLSSSGYVYIGMDHFAKETDEMTIAQKEKSLQRNFQGYSTKLGADIVAMGMSSISQLENVYAQNFKELPTYYSAIDSGNIPVEKGYILSDDDHIRRETIMRLMCDLELNYSVMSDHLGINFSQYFEKDLEGLDTFQKDNLIKMDSDGISITESGRLFIRNIAMEFDAYLEKDKARYSKTI